MAREIPIAKTYVQLLRTRYKNSIYGTLRSLFDTIVPVQITGTQGFSDQERPQFGIWSVTAAVAGQFPTASITSSVDISVEAVSILAGDSVGTILTASYLLIMPVQSWIPWANFQFNWFPSIRPRLQYDSGSTTVITGTNPLPSPTVGWQATSSILEQTVLYFDPPLILPATMFLTFIVDRVSTRLYCSWRYRELG